MKRINLLNDVHDFICLLKQAGVPTPYHIYWHWCEYRKSINDDVIDRYNDMLIEAISIWEGGRVFPPTMLEKLRHDVAVTASRRNNNYVPTQWQLRRDAVSGAFCPLSSKALLKFERALLESKISLTSIFGDKKTKKGLYRTQKILFCSVDAPSVPMNRKTKSRQEAPEYQLIIPFLVCLGCGNRWQ